MELLSSLSLHSNFQQTLLIANKLNLEMIFPCGITIAFLIQIKILNKNNVENT